MIIIEVNKSSQQGFSVLREIRYLRGMKDYFIDRRNSNRYRVMVQEPLGHTAYCFSTPIYNTDTGQLVNSNFNKSEDGELFIKGSNGTISISNNRCVLENRNGRIVLSFNISLITRGEKCQDHHNVVITPTLNGVRFIVDDDQLKFLLISEIKQESVRSSSTCFSIMSEQFKPFLSVAALYACDANGTISPVMVEYQDRGLQTYELTLFCKSIGSSFLFEVNLYEPKLFQDTTVESAHPDSNNVYGTIGFIGRTNAFGEQWLYSRPDFSKIPDLTSEQIEKALLHIPVLNGVADNVDIFIPQKRFCSFGSTWNNKIDPFNKVFVSDNDSRYLTIDVTNAFTNCADRTLIYNEGLILKKSKGKNNFIAISTGDSCSYPQILEIKLKN